MSWLIFKLKRSEEIWGDLIVFNMVRSEFGGWYAWTRTSSCFHNSTMWYCHRGCQLVFLELGPCNFLLFLPSWDLWDPDIYIYYNLHKWYCLPRVLTPCGQLLQAKWLWGLIHLLFLIYSNTLIWMPYLIYQYQTT